ncbi:uncharacterized protein LOC106131430 [Amyelois transitella]|uniref:uncharacterized protein LOC106131430 n=1 Tax=Amyelois transitella TaxID=680683 RepID=UPI00298FD473|nr:uncharacterized protein LOC106131430 [Amyelois transitella]
MQTHIACIIVNTIQLACNTNIDAGQRCYLCVANNSTSCDQASAVTTVECPGSCATVADAPNFTSSLQCAAPAEGAPAPCSLNYSRALQLTCRCTGHLCNAPFSRQLTNDLLNFSSTFPNKTADLTQTFFKIYSSTNFTGELYKAITVAQLTTTNAPLNITTVGTTSARTTIEPNKMSEIAPRAEPLKQDATAPSDDDEDESEGSGAYEDTRLHRNPASAPAAPSSFLPADENKSPPLYTHLFLTTPFLMLLTL